MMDEYVRYSIEEEGTFKDRKHHVVSQKDPDVEDTEPQMCPPAEHETSPDCVVVPEEDKKHKKRKRRKKKQKNAAQTPSVPSSITWAGFWKWLGILCLVGLIFLGAACAMLSSGEDKLGIGARALGDVTYDSVSAARSSSEEHRSAITPSSDSHNYRKEHLKAQDTPINGAPNTSEGSDEKLGIGDHESEDVTYESVSADVCAANVKVKEPPIKMMKDDQEVTLDLNVRCPHTQEHFGVNICFESDSTLRVTFKKGLKGLLFIEHGEERSEASTIQLDHKACSSSVEDRSAVTPTSLGDSGSHKSSRVLEHLKAQDTPINGAPNTSEGSGVTMKVLGGFGALLFLLSLLAALIFVVRFSRYRDRLFARAAAPHTVNV